MPFFKQKHVPVIRPGTQYKGLVKSRSPRVLSREQVKLILRGEAERGILQQYGHMGKKTGTQEFTIGRRERRARMDAMVKNWWADVRDFDPENTTLKGWLLDLAQKYREQRPTAEWQTTLSGANYKIFGAHA